MLITSTYKHLYPNKIIVAENGRPVEITPDADGKYPLTEEGKYEITALDLRTKNSEKKLKKYRRRINIIYGSINDSILIDALVKDQDFIIHLAGVLPPLADIKKDLSENIEYQGTENIIKAINYYNPKCHLFYSSSTTIYGDIKSASIKNKPKIQELDYYNNTKIKTEKLIKDKLKNYTILLIINSFKLVFLSLLPSLYTALENAIGSPKRIKDFL